MGCKGQSLARPPGGGAGAGPGSLPAWAPLPTFGWVDKVPLSPSPISSKDAQVIFKWEYYMAGTD